MKNNDKIKLALKKYLKKIIAEEDGIGYLTPFAFSKNKHKINSATQFLIKKFGFKLDKSKNKKYKTFDVVKEAVEFSNDTNGKRGRGRPKGSGVGNYNRKNPSIGSEKRRYMPKEFIFPKHFLDPLKVGMNQQEKQFRLVQNNGNYLLLASPLVKTALDDIQRGRTSFEKEQKLSMLTRMLKEKMPPNTRALVKAGLSNGKITDTRGGFIPVNVIISRVDEEGNPWIQSNSAGEIEDIQPKIYEVLDKLIYETLINELSYNNFRKDIKNRSKNEQLQKAVNEVKKRLQEVSKIVEYTTKIKNELSEADNGFEYDKNTQKCIEQISEMVQSLSTKLNEITVKNKNLDECECQQPSSEDPNINGKDNALFKLDKFITAACIDFAEDIGNPQLSRAFDAWKRITGEQHPLFDESYNNY